ncbi:probable 2-oxoglutarate-dependent dioxygenase AOP1 [Solanum dulcamara]|uniref:probable 2-oxoglutarate-dependent dioxygenase AOP1 n=1 Tax=Solanum dulcamara TaxID=45834 RepID=UPI0024853BE0|nr:probable 2-oxoglutarate-dependent dioxygenase AOP1 [Solanum dulcamara]
MDLKVPTIDFRNSSELKKGSEKWNLVRDEVFKSLEEYGCFEALLDGEIPKEKLYEKLKQVFNFNLENLFGKSQNVLVGYTRDNPSTPLQERMMIDNVLTHGVIHNFSNLLWPEGDPQFCDLVLTYSKKLLEFGDMVRRMVFDKLGLENYLDEHKKSGDCTLAFLKYRVPKAEETNVGVPPHTDKIISTILSQHDQDVNGLQIMDKNGQWHDVQYSSPHSYIFLVSDCLKAFTNGRLHSPTHRVIMGNEERYSMGFSTMPKEGYIIKVPEELVDEDHPLLYKPFDGSKLLPFFYSEVRRGVIATLENFCGVSANNPNLSCTDI